MCPPSSALCRLVCTTMARAFQRMSERMRRSMPASPGAGVSREGGMVLMYAVVASKGRCAPAQRARSTSCCSKKCARSTPACASVDSSASIHSCVSSGSASRASGCALPCGSRSAGFPCVIGATPRSAGRGPVFAMMHPGAKRAAEKLRPPAVSRYIRCANHAFPDSGTMSPFRAVKEAEHYRPVAPARARKRNRAHFHSLAMARDLY